MKPIRLLALWVMAVALAAGPALAQVPKIPLADFFDEGSIRGMSMSPNGRWLAARVVPAEGGNVRLVVLDLEGKEPATVVAAFTRANVRSAIWLNDDVIIVSAAEDKYKGRVPRYPSLMSVPRDGKSMRLLIKAEFGTEFAASGNQPLEANHEFLSLGAPGSDEIIVGEMQFDAAFEIKSLRPLVVNVRNGARRSLLKNDVPYATAWLFDHQGRARLATSRKDNEVAYHWLDLGTQEWKELARFENLKAPFWPQFVDGSGHLYVQVNAADNRGDELRRFDFATGKPGTEVIVATPGFDSRIAGLTDRNTGQLLGLNVLTDASLTVWTEPALADLQKKVDAMLPGRVNVLLCNRCDRHESILVNSYSDRSAGDYLIFKPRTNEWRRMGSARPRIAESAMGAVRFERIKARDGADLPIWVTLPASSEKLARPAVVLVHGGPWVRGRVWGWNSESQFLASRGYVVIEPEFRGSTGYGETHFRAGFRQWGQAMQDDVSDALEWVVRQGWVDPARVCIAGASYGGYATLMGLAKRPDEFRCGVAWVAVSDPQLMYSIHWSDISNNSKKYSMRTLIGDPEKDATMLAANSPLALVERIKAPVLLAYGGKDRRVPIEHGERMRDALTKAGRPPEWVVYSDEAHGWRFEESLFDFWSRVEAFLAKHIGP